VDVRKYGVWEKEEKLKRVKNDSCMFREVERFNIGDSWSNSGGCFSCCVNMGDGVK